MRQSEKDKAEACERLREMLPPGSIVYCILRNVSRSGMSRSISLYTGGSNGDGMAWITGQAAKVLGMKVDKREGITMGGCGMDMGFALVSDLARTLYPDGFTCTGSRETAWRQYTAEDCPGKPCSDGCDHRQSFTSKDYCPSNDHSNGDRDYTPHHHKSGSYALRHRWL